MTYPDPDDRPIGPRRLTIEVSPAAARRRIDDLLDVARRAAEAAERAA